jgi:hypothetical protein
MKHHLQTIILVFIISLVPSAWAYSPFWNIDGWDAARLKESGITIASWKHDTIGEFPAANWIEITYDGAKEQEALMTLQLHSGEDSPVTFFRAVRAKGEKSAIKLLFAVPEKFDQLSSVEIVVPEALAAGAKHEQEAGTVGNPGWGGFTLSLSRIIELAGPKADAIHDKAIEKPNEGGSVSDSGNAPTLLRPLPKEESPKQEKAGD